MNVIVELNGAQVVSIKPDADVVPPGHQRVTADEETLRNVDSLAFLSVVGGILILDTAAQDAARQQAAAEMDALRDDALAQDLSDRLRRATAAQIGTWVDSQVVDLPNARTMFKRILLLMAYKLKG